MGRQSKVQRYELEGLVVDGRKAARTVRQIAEACNAQLVKQGIEDSLTPKSVERYLSTLDEATVAPAHSPVAAEANATVAIDYGKRLRRLDELLGKWLDEAEGAVQPMRGVLWDPYQQSPADPETARDHASELAEGMQDAIELLDTDTAAQLRDWIRPVTVLVPDWQARTSVSREMREHLKAYADLMARIFDAQQVQAFQQSVVEAIEEASPEVAHLVLAKLQSKQSIQRAALLGAGT